jgi:peptidoglycan/LPS O-acetylase OafA/YrhL
MLQVWNLSRTSGLSKITGPAGAEAQELASFRGTTEVVPSRRMTPLDGIWSLSYTFIFYIVPASF